MKIIPFIAALWIALNAGYSNEQAPRSFEKGIENLAAFTQENADTSWITDDIRLMLVDSLLKELPGAERERRCEIEMILVTIGHLDTIRRLAENMKAGEESRGLEFSATEAAIPSLMNVVLTGSTDIPGFGDGDVFQPSVRVRAAKIVLEIIRSRKAFPTETTRWFSSLDPLNDTKENLMTLALLESWWKENQAAIEAQKYSEATRLPAAGGETRREHFGSTGTRGVGGHRSNSDDYQESEKRRSNGDGNIRTGMLLYLCGTALSVFIIWPLMKIT